MLTAAHQRSRFLGILRKSEGHPTHHGPRHHRILRPHRLRPGIQNRTHAPSIAHYDQEIDRLLVAHPDADLLSSLPGLARTGPPLLAAFGNRPLPPNDAPDGPSHRPPRPTPLSIPLERD